VQAPVDDGDGSALPSIGVALELGVIVGLGVGDTVGLEFKLEVVEVVAVGVCGTDSIPT